MTSLRSPRQLDGIMSAIRAAESIAIACHISPDGDTVGSALALQLALAQMDKSVTLFSQDKIPDILAFLPGADKFCDPDAAEGSFDLLLCVDISDVKRMGRCERLLGMAKDVVQIDHHGTNARYARENCVDGTAPANALIIREMLVRMGCDITKEIALCLAVGLSTDTGHLSYGSTTPEAFHAMGDLVAAGAPMGEAYRTLYRQRPVRQVALLARALNTLTFYHGGEITGIRLTSRDFEECGALMEDAEIIVNYGLEIQGVKMTAFAREANDRGDVKLSMRSVEPYSVAKVAVALGGGGHPQAAGATVQMSLETALDEAVRLMKQELEQHA